MKAYTNTRYTKEETIKLIHEHIKADALITGRYWDEGVQRGCHVGCLTHSTYHSDFIPLFGIDPTIAELCDVIHEGLPNQEERVNFFKMALPAIPIGVDTKLVWNKFAKWLMIDPEHGVIRVAETDEEKNVIVRVAELHNRVASGEPVSELAWAAAEAAAEAAWAAAGAAAEAAAWAAAGAAARAAVRTAAGAAARTAAGAAAEAAWDEWDAWDAARDAHFQIMANKLVDILGDLSSESDTD